MHPQHGASTWRLGKKMQFWFGDTRPIGLFFVALL
jgi:hypothetical protein